MSCPELRFVNFLLNEYCTVLYCIVYCIQAESPHFVENIAILENVQKVATNLVGLPMLQKYSYAVRLRMIERRIRGDMTGVYKQTVDGKRRSSTDCCGQASSSTSQTHHVASEDTRNNWRRWTKIGYKEIFLH